MEFFILEIKRLGLLVVGYSPRENEYIHFAIEYIILFLVGLIRCHFGLVL